jgi:hypothetical protein
MKRMTVRGSLSAMLLAAAVMAVPVATHADAKPKSSETKAKRSKAAKAPKAKTSEKSVVRKKSLPQSTGVRGQFAEAKRAYRQGEISRKTMWERLSDIHERGSELPKDDRVSLLQSQARLLMEAGYPILAAIYGSQAVKIAEDPLDRELQPTWEILRRVSERRPIQNLLEIVADSVELGNKTAPVFGSDWYYFAGNAAAREGKDEKAQKLYGELKIDDRYFFPGKYQQAMLHVEKDKLDEAEVALKAILYPTSQKMSPLSEDLRKQMSDYAYMALGRIYYEQEQFLAAAKMYRNVSRDGINFYDALFEQGWAFFLGGYPMHALGAVYAVESPFYEEVFNPEATMLRAMVHYWLCRYEDSRNALADFMDKHADTVEELNDYLDRERLDTETAYQLFENLVSGVSAKSLGVPKNILRTAAEKDSMMLVRDQYAAIVEEKARLESKGIFGLKTGLGRPTDYVDRWAASLRKDIGKKYLSELQDMQKDYERLYAQAEFLYVELLMSEKDQILGKELHASSKITKVSQRLKVTGWGDKMQGWKGSRLGEYWWDEVGFYIAPVEPKCAVR